MGLVALSGRAFQATVWVSPANGARNSVAMHKGFALCRWGIAARQVRVVDAPRVASAESRYWARSKSCARSVCVDGLSALVMASNLSRIEFPLVAKNNGLGRFGEAPVVSDLSLKKRMPAPNHAARVHLGRSMQVGGQLFS